jgi:hypothetical protein
MPHLLKNGHPAHVFTTEDRRKAAAVTNQIRRERAEIVALELENRLCEERLARIEARRSRKAAQARARRARIREQESHSAQAARPSYIDVWLQRGYGARF